MAAQPKVIALNDLPQHLHSCFNSAVSGDIIRITDADQEAILISKDNFAFIVECLQRYQRLLNK